MSSFLTHVVLGLFVGLALGARVRDLPWYIFFAEWMDIDHFFDVLERPDPWWLLTRGSFHNVFIVSILPALAAGYLLLGRNGWVSRWRGLIAGAPVCMVSHVLLDMLDVPLLAYHPFGGVHFYYPFATGKYYVPLGQSFDPRWFDGLALAFLTVGALVLLARAVATRPDTPDASKRVRPIAAYVVVLAVVIPLCLALLASRSPVVL